MTSHLRRFVTAPLPIFQVDLPSDLRAATPLTAAAKCLALCINVGRTELGCTFVHFPSGCSGRRSHHVKHVLTAQLHCCYE